MNFTWVAAALTAELISFACLSQVQRHLLAAGGIHVRPSAMLGLALEANAINVTLPGGSAVAAGYSLRRFRSWGASSSAAAFAVLASGALSTLAFGALVVAWAVTAGGTAARAAVWVALPGTVLAALILLQRDRLTRFASAAVAALTRLLRRPPGHRLERFSRFVADLRSVRPRRWQWCAGLWHAGLNWVADLACLAASYTAVNGEFPGLGAITAAYAVGVAASAASFLPAGLGATEAAMIGTLCAGGSSAATAGAVVVCYRIVSVAFVVALGWALCARRRWLARIANRATGDSADLSGRTGP